MQGGEAGKDNPEVHPSLSGAFTNDPKDLGLELSDSEDETRFVLECIIKTVDPDLGYERNCRKKEWKMHIGICNTDFNEAFF